MKDARQTETELQALSHLVHDLKNHLTIVSTWLEFALDEVADDTALKGYLTDAQTAAENAGELADTILPIVGGGRVTPQV